MTKIVVQSKDEEALKTVPLKQVEIGNYFYFPHLTFEQAQHENAIYMVIADPSAKAKQVRIISIDGKSDLKRDSDRHVVPLEVKIAILR